MMRVLVFTLLTLAAMTVALPIKREERELLEVLLQRILGEEKRSASRVIPGLDESLQIPGMISVSLLTNLNSDKPDLESKTCYYDVKVLNAKNEVVHKETYEKSAVGTNMVVINELEVSAAGTEYAVQTCRIDIDFNVYDNRCTCHRCKLFDTQDALNNNNFSYMGNECIRDKDDFTVPANANSISNCFIQPK